PGRQPRLGDVHQTSRPTPGPATGSPVSTMTTTLYGTTDRAASRPPTLGETRAIIRHRAGPGHPGPTPPARSRQYPRRVPGLLLALPVSVLTLGILLPGLGRRALWNDEYATWYASTLSPGDLLRLFGHVDAVVAPYYVFMHAWIDLFGDSATSLRLP